MNSTPPTASQMRQSMIDPGLSFDMTQPPPGYGHKKNNNNYNINSDSSKSSKMKHLKHSSNELYSPILDNQSDSELFDNRTNSNGEVRIFNFYF